MAKINKFKLLPHASYLLDLAPSDYFLFPNLKQWLGGQRFANNKEVESAVNGYFEELDGSHHKQDRVLLGLRSYMSVSKNMYQKWQWPNGAHIVQFFSCLNDLHETWHEQLFRLSKFLTRSELLYPLFVILKFSLQIWIDQPKILRTTGFYENRNFFYTFD